jgi:putative transposase
VVAHVYQRMVNRRKDFAHKLSRSMVNEYGVIALEKLDTQGMLRNHYLAKSIADAAWHQLVRYTLYKAEEAGRACVLVDPNGTSQRCSRCGRVVKKSLAVRVHDCPICGLKMDRDENAAINILALGLQCLDVGPRSHAALAAVE